jgi:hypothetical protein
VQFALVVIALLVTLVLIAEGGAVTDTAKSVTLVVLTGVGANCALLKFVGTVGKALRKS